jgi:hypothetical protein
MRKLLITLLAFVSLALNIKAQINLTDGLVGFWPFNGNAKDESGNDNHGWVNGATLTTDRFGRSNNAYHFSGNNTITTSFAGISGYKDRSISFWVKINLKQDGGFVFSYGEFACGKLFAPAITIPSENRCNAHLHTNESWINFKASSKNDDEWQHYVYVFSKLFGNSLNGIRIYQNGDLLTDITECNNQSSCNIDTGTSLPFTFGSIFNWYQNSISIDDTRFYNRILTEQEINALYKLEEECI